MAAFEVLGKVASTSSGAVWKARDVALNRIIALKELDATVAADEAAALARLSSEHVVTVHGVVTDDGRTYLVEEWIDGATLAAVLRENGALSPQQALGVVRGALLGLADAHRAGIVHGDVSATNILVSPDGGAKLVDFGSAVRAGSSARAATSAYAAPEIRSGGAATPAADVYAAAAVLAALLHGRTDATPSTRGVDPALRPVLDTALDDDPGGRYPDAAAFLAALETAAARRYGAEWWTRAGLGATATTASVGLVSVLAGAPFAATTGGTAVAASGGTGIGSVGGTSGVSSVSSTGGASAGQGVGAAAGGSRKTLYVSSGVGGAVVAGAVIAFVSLGGEDPKPPERQGFGGTYRVTSTITSSTFPNNPVGSKRTGTSTIRARCNGGSCVLTIAGYFKQTETLSGSGRRLMVTATAPNQCNTNASQRAVDVTEKLALDLTATGTSARPRVLRGTLTNSIAKSPTCRGANSTSAVVFTRVEAKR